MADLRLVSVLIPLYNEEELVGTLIERVFESALPPDVQLEVVVVDDGSSDASPEVVAALTETYSGRLHLIRHGGNRGKGAAIRTAVQHGRGEFAIIQDADLEYDPSEYARLLGPLLAGRADAVYGSRFLVAGERRVLYYWHAVSNRILTTLCNMAADLNLTDMGTCYKAFRLSLIRSIPLRSNRFGIEPELTIKLAQRKACIYELPISYYGRTYAEGKKIRPLDAVPAFFTILRFAFSRDIYLGNGARILDALAHTPRFNRWMTSVVSPFLGVRVLEIGAGIGNLTLSLSRRRQSYTATDCDAEHVARLKTRLLFRPNISVCECDLENSAHFTQFSEKFDSVVCINVLEHVQDDLQGLRNMRSALREGGNVVILVPHDQRIYGSLDHVLEHHRRYSRHELRSKVEAAGFRIERLIEFNRITRPGWILNGKLLKRKSFGRFQLWVFDRLVWLWKRIDHRLPWQPASLVVIASKQEAHPRKPMHFDGGPIS